jgi:predicted PurR-regulated permease PerM
VRGAVEQISKGLTSGASAVVSVSVAVIVELLITLFALFYFFRDRRPALRGLRSLVPLSEDETDAVFVRVKDTIYATVYGTLTVALVQGCLGGLMFWVLGLPAALLWGTVMAVLAVVPVLGAFVVWVPAALFLLLEGSWGKALILAAWGVLVVSLVDNLLYPVLVGQRLRLHTLPVFIAIVGGLALFGSAGVVLGPVTLAVTVALVEIWRRRTAGGRTAETGVDA